MAQDVIDRSDAEEAPPWEFPGTLVSPARGPDAREEPPPTLKQVVVLPEPSTIAESARTQGVRRRSFLDETRAAGMRLRRAPVVAARWLLGR